jgi:hypothetical protein
VTRAAALHNFTRSYTIKGQLTERWNIAKDTKKHPWTIKKTRRKLYRTETENFCKVWSHRKEKWANRGRKILYIIKNIAR